MEAISIQNLKVGLHIGVPVEERSQLQVVHISLKLYPEASFIGIDDEIEKTINYFDVSQVVIRESTRRPRKLLETLIEDIGRVVLDSYALRQVFIRVDKFIIPQADSVSVESTITRENRGSTSL